MEQITTDIKIIEENKQFIEIRTKADTALEWANALEVKDPADLGEAGENLLLAKEQLKVSEASRRFFTDPLNEHVKRINAIFKPWTTKLENAILIINQKMVLYNRAQLEKAEKEKARVLKQIEAGKITIEQGAKKLEKAVEPEKTVRTESGTTNTFVTRKMAVITDQDKLPRKYLLPDLQLILRDLKVGIKIPGAELTEEQTVASRRSIPF